MSAPATPPRGATRVETAAPARGRRLLLPAITAAVLLTVAYCVLIPAAILRR